MELLNMVEAVFSFLSQYGPVGAALLAINALIWAWLLITGKIISASQHRDLKDQLRHCRESGETWKQAWIAAVSTAEKLLPGDGRE